jgi:DNA-binding GntR family transcriptional regulator
MTLPNIDIKTLREHTYRAIKDLILKNEYLPGDYLPIKKVASDLGISETPVREALAMLKAEGLIDNEPHRKPQIADITEEEVKQVYEVRKLLEPYAATLVVENLAKDLELKGKLLQVHELVRKVLQDPTHRCSYDEYIEIDLRLNEIFLQAINNRLLREVLSLVSSRSMRIRTFVEATTKAQLNVMIHQITNEHDAIIQAMLCQDSKEAHQKVYDHLINAELRTLGEMRSYKGMVQPVSQLRTVPEK